MWGDKYIQVLLLLLIHSITLILLFFKTTGLVFRIELLLFLVLLFISLIYLFGLFFEEGWAWVLLTIFFAINLINLLVLKRFVTGNLLSFGILLVVDLVGFFMGIANIGEEEEDLEIEPYDAEKKKEKKEDAKVEVYNTKDKSAEKKASEKKPAKKKAVKKKPAKKKAAKKKAGK